MIEDLVGKGSIESKADFIVIGAGTVGLPLAVELASRTGLNVVVLESGGYHQDAETNPLNSVVQHGDGYAGADHGRFRCLGGTSTRWGGALIPFQAADLHHAEWPITLADLEPHIPTVEALFSLERGLYEDPKFPFPLGKTHVNRLAKWPAFKRRNVVNLVEKAIKTQANPKIWLNATVTEVHAEADGSGVSVLARSAAGDILKIAAPRLIVAAGAIETTRLALLIDQQNGGAISQASPSLGRYFTDHLSTGVAEIEPTQTKALNRIIGFRFSANGGMRNIRFELAHDATERKTLTPSFSHIGFQTDTPGGFDALREIFRWLQMRKIPPARVLLNLTTNLPWLINAVWWRFAYKRLLFPSKARLVVHTVVEQIANADNRITLSANEVDSFGVPKAEIHWGINEADIDNINYSAELFKKTWETTNFSDYGTWKQYTKAEIGLNLVNSGGIFHPTGSTRMGKNSTEGVVGENLQIFPFPQIQLVSTSVLPSGGGANPTMMLMLLAMRCIAQHSKQK